MEVSKRKVHTNIRALEQNDKFLLFFIGKKPLQSVKVLQRFYRRRIFAKKLKRLKAAYEHFHQNSLVKVSKSFSKYIKFLYSKSLLFDAKDQNLIQKKLIKIRENLSIIKIKQILKKFKLKIKTIKHRIKRYSKKFHSLMIITNNQTGPTPLLIQERSVGQTDSKLSYKISTEEETKPLIKPSVLQPSKLSNSFENVSVDSEEQKLINDKKREKVAKGLISHNIKARKNSLTYLPLFLENEPEARPQTTRSIVTRMNLVNPVRIMPKLFSRKKKIVSKSEIKKLQKYGVDDIPPYMKDTKNSIFRYLETPSPTITVPRRQKDNKILYPTFSFAQKTKSSDTKIVNKPSAPSSRPATGPRLQRRIYKTAASSDINIVQPSFNPQINDFSDLETQSIRPFFVKIRPGLEKLKGYYSNKNDIKQ